MIDPTADGIQVTYLGPVVQFNVYPPGMCLHVSVVWFCMV